MSLVFQSTCTLQNMADVVPADNEDSRSSVIEIEPPKKPEPLFIDLADEEVVINVKSSLPNFTSGSNGPSSDQCYNDSENLKQNGNGNSGETEGGEEENGNATSNKNELDEKEEEEEEEAEEVEEEEDDQQQEEEEDGDDEDDESAAKDGGAEQTEDDEDKEIENERVSKEGSEHKGEPKEIKEEGAENEGDDQDDDQDYKDDEDDEDDEENEKERKPYEGVIKPEIKEDLDDEEEEDEQYDQDTEGDEAQEGTSSSYQKAMFTSNSRQMKTSSKSNQTTTQSKSTTQSTTLFNYDPVPSNALGTYPPPLTSIKTFLPSLTSIGTYPPPLSSLPTYTSPLNLSTSERQRSLPTYTPPLNLSTSERQRSLPTYTPPLNLSTSGQQSSFPNSQEFQPSHSQNSESFSQPQPSSRFSYNTAKRPKMNDAGPSHPTHWTPEMVKYYDGDLNKEEFNVEKLQGRMDKNPSLWQISSKDLSSWKNKNKKTDPKCYNCLNYGHESYNCMEQKKPPMCHMCGFQGHVALKCPHSMCLNCGTATTGYVTKCRNCRFGFDIICERCNLTGHFHTECTDHWRLYHSTIGTKRVIEPKEEIYKPPRNRWCCNCGRRGHLQVDCGYCGKNHEFSDTLPFVTSYVKTFTRGNQMCYGYENCLKTQPLKIDMADNIMTNPNQKHVFHRKTSQLRNRLRAIKRTSDRVERQGNMDRWRHPGGGFNHFSFL